ncbi:hypothetical protein Cph01nite_29570 [Cellulomonas phragmiteti]|uniref:Lipoprotein n=1 Tax=Cellulomonas phragmiteti TaxID=478780 RepID=A0ABQ4DPB4_9CELL|nr:hypothetical protein Cph01nite_29570 [Cellulomonas phragmiteti]
MTAVLVVLPALAVAACGGPDRRSGGGDDAGVGADLLGTYGYGPDAEPAATLQDDVVLIAGGPAAIRSARGDGLQWVLDGDADGVAGLQVGDVMFASASAVGRVAELAPVGDDVAVTISPVGLAEVVRDATIEIDRALDPGTMRYQVVPDLPGVVSEPDLGTTEGIAGAEGVPSGDAAAGAVVLPAVRLLAAPAGAVDLPPSSTTQVEVPLGDWSVTASGSSSRLSLKLEHDVTTGLKAGVETAFGVEDLRIQGGVTVSDSILGDATMLIEGLRSVSVTFSAGIGEGGTADNESVRLEVPIVLTIPIPPSPATGGLPLNLTVTFKALASTALSGSNSTLLATGRYGLAGPIGLRDGSLVTPELSVQQSLMDSIQGLTLGPSGIVVGTSVQVQIGIGPPAFSAGPYGKLTTSIGVTQGSALGSPLVTCQTGTLDMKVAGGASLKLSASVNRALERLLPPGTNLEYGVEASTTVLTRSQTTPDVPLCRG